MEKWQSEDQRQKIPIPWPLYLVIGFIALLIVGAMAHLFQQTRNIDSTHDTPLEVISEIELKYTTAHLWFEEILSGDRTEKIKTVRNSIDQAERLLRALKVKEFDSGEHARSHGAGDPIKDIVIFHFDHKFHVMLSMQETIEFIEEKLNKFRDILEKRHSAWQTSGPGTEIDQRFDVVFAQLLKGTGEIRKKIYASKANHLAQFRAIQIFLIFTCLALVALVALILHRFDRRRANALLAELRSKDLLKKSEEKYRTLIENAGEAIIVAQDGEIKFANPKGEELYGYSQEELASRPLSYFIHEEDREMVGERHKKRLKGEEPPTTYSFRIVDKNGNIKWVELCVALFSWDDRPATLCFMTDITERMRMEEASKKVIALETLNVVLENFVSDALGNRLNSIYGRIQLCGIGDNIDQIKSEIEVIEEEIAKLLTGINAYREFFRLGEHSLEKISSTDISYILGHCSLASRGRHMEMKSFQ
jgi:PAS domain S-box-containing protein